VVKGLPVALSPHRNGKLYHYKNRVWRVGPDVAMVSTLVGEREFQEGGFPDHIN